MNSAADLERFLHEQIPLTVAMGVQVAECDDTRLVLTAPLAPNRNHLQTAFGGSLHALATLSGYSLLWWLLREPHAHIVIRESTIRYKNPVRGDLRAVCHSPAAQELERFRRDFARKGKARISLDAVVEYDDEIAVRFSGVFVAINS
ncbi:MAG: YiiD C-terminal domain-containing protein [Chthoniobacter sp.]|uniref:YiiD C-terminal domain-containing protein n=1 Tax=Chthoniobacter sp. TaxID=2510640 RepID=UPI0032ACD864